MKLVFSEHISDYANYIFPYAIWALPEKGEKPRQLFDAGFLPSSPSLDRFYLCRQVRVDLRRFRLSSENRRVLRKGEGIAVELVPRSRFEYSRQRRSFFKAYADIKFGRDVMTFQRLDNLFDSPLVTHLLVFTDSGEGNEVGVAMIHMDGRALAFYYYAFYDLDYFQRNVGMFMMTSAVRLFAEQRTRRIYLGSCYSKNALYKTQFAGAQFFNGFRWSDNLKELKHLLDRDTAGARTHLVNSDEFLRTFYDERLDKITETSRFQVNLD